MLEIIKATKDMIDALDILYQSCTLHMRGAGIYQWDESYPNRETLLHGIVRQDLFCATEDGVVIGAVILNTKQATEYAGILWTTRIEKFLVIHTFAVHPEFQGKGYGKRMLLFSEEYAKNNEFCGIRLDTFSQNPIAISMYERNQYTCTGAVFFSHKPSPYNWYLCYEKLFDT